LGWFPVLLSAALLLILIEVSVHLSFCLISILLEFTLSRWFSCIVQSILVLGHPEVYIVLLPALGITSEVIATNSRKPIFGYRAMIMSILAIAFYQQLFGVTMFISGMNPF
jgi:cytochrome c oxidase subunit 1